MPKIPETPQHRLASRLLSGELATFVLSAAALLLPGCQRDSVSASQAQGEPEAGQVDAKLDADGAASGDEGGEVDRGRSADPDRGARAKAAADTPETIPDGPTTEPQYHVVAKAKAGVSDDGEGNPRFKIFGTDDGEVLIAHGPWLMRPDADGTLEQDPSFIRGIELPEIDPVAVTSAVDWTIHSLGGRWPDSLYMANTYVTPFRGDVYYNQTYRWLGDGWLRLDTERPRYVSFPERIEAWGDSSIALRSFAPRYSKSYDEMGAPKSEQRAIEAAIAKVKPLSVYAGPAKAPRLPEAIADFDARPSGELLAITVADPPRVITFDPKTEESTITALPDAADSSIFGIKIVDDGRGYAFGSTPDEEHEQDTPYLARFDGEAWHKEKGPPCGAGLIGVSWSKSAGLYAICLNDRDFGVYPTGDLWRLISGGWIEVELPLRGSVTGVVADGPGGVWITTTLAAYGPKPPRKILEVGGFEETATRMAEYGPPSPTRLHCAASLDVHYTLLNSEPGGDHPEEKALLATALAGDEAVDAVAVVEVEFRGAPRVALQVQIEIEAPVIRKIEEAFGERLGDTYCFSREPL